MLKKVTELSSDVDSIYSLAEGEYIEVGMTKYNLIGIKEGTALINTRVQKDEFELNDTHRMEVGHKIFNFREDGMNLCAKLEEINSKEVKFKIYDNSSIERPIP